MKGKLRIVRSLVKRACAEQVAGVAEQHVRVVEALSNDDLIEIEKKGVLASARLAALPESEETKRDTVSLLIRWLRGPSDELLRQHGISITKVDDGMSEATYDETYQEADLDDEED